MDTEKELKKFFGMRNNVVSPSTCKNKRRRGRDSLAVLFGELGFKIGAEIGVRKGNFSLEILNAMKDGKLILVDPWCAYEECSESKAEVYYRQALKRLSKYEDNIIVKRMTSLDAVKEIEDGSLDFVYIDGIHDFNNAAVDIINWAPKVRKGGIVSGHDYFNGPNFGVIEAVNGYTKAHQIKNWYVTIENVPSWFWVKG